MKMEDLQEGDIVEFEENKVYVEDPQTVRGVVVKLPPYDMTTPEGMTVTKEDTVMVGKTFKPRRARPETVDVYYHLDPSEMRKVEGSG